MNIYVIRPDLAADSIPPQLAAQQRRAEKTRQRVRKLREMAFEEIERLIAFLDASDGYTMHEREEAVDDVPCDDHELEFSFCGVTADKCSMPHSEYDDELEEGCEDEGAADDREEDPAESGIADFEGLLEQVGSQGWTHTVMG